MQAKSQVAVEFIFMASIALLLVVVVAAGIGSQIGGITSQKEAAAIQDIAFAISVEISTAAHAQHGYSRSFILESSTDGVDYTPNILGNTLIVQGDTHEFSIRIPSVVGNIIIGNNTINNTNGKVYLN